ncbi:Mobile element protein [Sphingobacterium sp. JB170]|nr:Mobile element protein [Sphingobacterium sp. JB170]
MIIFNPYIVMIDKERLLNDKDFYKSFKSGEDLTSFFKQMHKRA